MTEEACKKQLAALKRRRTRERGNVTRFLADIGKLTDDSSLEDFQYYRERLQETLVRLTSLDDEVHEQLDDGDYEADVQKCEEYIDSSKRAIIKLSNIIEKRLTISTANVKITDTSATAAAPSATLRLPPIRLEPFSGDIETWARFWEQFEQSIDKDPSLSIINKHIFLRGYLEGEPKHLIEGIAVIADTYEETKRILQARYGDKNRIIQAHLDYLEAIKPIQYPTPEALNLTFIDCHRRIEALKALGEDVNGYGRVLAPKILRAFPDDICRRWIIHVKQEGLSEGNMLKLMAFLGAEVDAALTTQKIRGEHSTLSDLPSTAAALHVNSKSRAKSRKTTRLPQPFCVFCEAREHWAQDCKEITDVTERRSCLRKTNRCFLCLNRGHTASSCEKREKAQCSNCRKMHHRSICDDGKRKTEQKNTTSVAKIDVTVPGFTYLQTAQVMIIGPTGLSKLTRCVMDSGSQSSFIARTLVDELKLEVMDQRELTVCTFESQSNTSTKRKLIRFNMKGAWTNSTVPVCAYECSHTLSPQPAVPQDVKTLAQTRKLQLADPKTDSKEDLPVEILIGGDFYWRIVKVNSPIRTSSSTVLIPSIFGWILSGSRSGISVNSAAVNFINIDEPSVPMNSEIRHFWDLEIMGITDNPSRALNTEDSAILEEFRTSFRVEKQRRVVSLPKKKDVALPNNLRNAEIRLSNLERRLERDDHLKEMYYSQMLDYIKKGQVELPPVTDSSDAMFYLPHQAVKKEKLGKTKWRIVFDASSHEPNAPSLNEALEMGPNLLPEILAILLRFRLHPIAIVSDIREAFLQLVLDEKDRDLTRFLWYNVIEDSEGNYFTGNEVTTYRFTRLPFGLTCSPFLLSAALREHADRHKMRFPIAAPLIDSNTYMDDFAAGGESENHVIALYYELTALMKLLSFPLAKWASNSNQLRMIWKAEGQVIEACSQVLGVVWNTDTDCLIIYPEELSRKAEDGPTTKRKLLQATSMFYDPLGLLSPVSVVGKLLFQETWCRGIGWDELLPPDLGSQWYRWVCSLSSLSQLRAPRWLATSRESDSQVHVFCDASEKAYGAVLYVRSSSEDNIVVRLSCSKNRLAPVKKVTLPRLELLAALMGTRLLRYFCTSTGYNITHATLWTDATVTLGWIRSNPNRWKTFICNRVTEIQNFTTPSQWRHCPGQDNPADYLSRGLSGDQIQHLDVWWHGPVWLARPINYWPSNVLETNTSLPEAKRKTDHVLTATIPSSLIDACKFSSYWKLTRTTAWVFRFTNNVRQREKMEGELTAAELKAARMYWVQVVQRESFAGELHALKGESPMPRHSKITRYNPFIEDGLLRLGGRLQCADLPREQLHPLLLDGNHHFTKLLILETHTRLHHFGVRIVLSELRTEFWILRARQVIKKVLHTCLPCKLQKQHRGEQIEAPLPSDRVQPAKPFVITGIDFAGPLYVKVGREMQKAYIALFTCASTRAVHLELCSKMTTDAFLMALQRFTGRRGLPHTIYTDNATSFHATNAELKELWTTLSATKTYQFLAHNGITWKFIAPRAAWWGGWWERMVGTTKRCLRKILGQAKLTEEQLNTTLVSIEAAINSRPITQGEDSVALTPAHFLTGEKLTTIPSGPEPTQPHDLAKEFRLRQKLADDFWKRWTKEYILQLRSFHEVQQPRGKTPLHIGDVVLIHEDIRPRHLWRKAVIEGLQPGRDLKIRTVFLRTSDGHKMSRPIQLVVPLEIDQGGEDVGNNMN